MFSAALQKADSAHQNQRYQDALKYYTEALQHKPKDSYALGQRGNVRLALNDHGGAEKDFTDAIAQDSNNAYALRGRGVIKVKIHKDYNGALSDFTKSLRIEPNSAFAFNNCAEIERRLKHLDKALEYAENSIRLEPREAVYITIRGIIKFDRADYRGALDDLDDSLRINSQQAEALHWRAKVKYALKDVDGASVDCESSLRITSDQQVRELLSQIKNERESKLASSRYAEISQASDRNDYARTEALCNSLLNDFPKDVWAYKMRAYARRMLNNSQGALDDISRVLALAPNDEWGQEQRKEILEEKTKALKKDTEKKALAAYNARNYSNAVDQLDNLVTLDPKNAWAIRLRAQAHMALKMLSEALQDYELSLAVEPNSYAVEQIGIIKTALRQEKLDAIKEERKLEQVKKSLRLNRELDAIKSQADGLNFASVQTIESLLQRYQASEPLAFQTKNSLFFVHRGDFYFTLASKTQTPGVNPKLLYANAIRDYRQALQYDLSNASLSEKLEAAQAAFESAPLPSRADLTPAALAKLEEIKAKRPPFSHMPSAPRKLTRQDLNVQQISELERIKQQLRQQYAVLINQTLENLFQKGLRLYQQERFLQAKLPLQHAAQLNHAGAQYYLALYYEQTDDDGNKKIALNWYQAAAKQNHPQAKQALERHKSRASSRPSSPGPAAAAGYATPKPPVPQARTPVAAPQSAIAPFDKGVELYRAKQYEAAIPYFKNAGESDLKIQHHIGLCYQALAEQNPARENDYLRLAIQWYQKAADQGYPHAKIRLANLNARIPSPPASPPAVAAAASALTESTSTQLQRSAIMKQAVQLFEEEQYIHALKIFNPEATRGDAEAQYYLGLCYEDGLGELTESATLAAKWFEAAAEQGYSAAQYKMGVLCDNGTDADLEAAFRWYQKAARQNSDAQTALARCYEEGRGIGKDINRAIYWYRKAEDSNDFARARLKILSSDYRE